MGPHKAIGQRRRAGHHFNARGDSIVYILQKPY